MPLQTIQLGNGVEVPVVAFGTGEHGECRLTSGTDHAFGDCSTAVTRALRAGLTHLDCAWWYKNQHHIARVLPARHEIFITSKIGDFHGDAENFDANKYVDECLAEVSMLSDPWVDCSLVWSTSTWCSCTRTFWYRILCLLGNSWRPCTDRAKRDRSVYPILLAEIYVASWPRVRSVRPCIRSNYIPTLCHITPSCFHCVRRLVSLSPAMRRYSRLGDIEAGL